MKVVLTVLLLQIVLLLRAQEIKTWNPLSSPSPVIEGRGWPGEMDKNFFRLPERAKHITTPAIWNLSNNSAGLLIRFHTSSPSLVVKYKVSGGLSFPHMPSTGVSGLDLYGKDRDGKWFWFPGRYSFADTITYTFNKLHSAGDTTDRLFEYQLYLPLYNTVTWMEFSYPENKNLFAAGIRAEKPIVVYGTSIAQGGCASRPGLAWTAQLERALDRPLINLGFSGNGRLDSALINMMAEIDARVFILDCLPNLTDVTRFPDEDIRARIKYAVKHLQSKRPQVPIILSEHSAGGRTSGILGDSSDRHLQVNNILKEVHSELNRSGNSNIFLLTTDEIGFTSDATVDGIHPADIGMRQNAIALEILLRKIFHEPSGEMSTTIPVSQSRDAFYFMPHRHQEIILMNRTKKPETVFIGNSIVHMWGGQPSSSIINGAKSWEDFFTPLNTVNMGFGWDRVENVLWRTYHDELDGFEAKRILLMIGTNNIGLNSDDEILTGLHQLYSSIKRKQPGARLYVFGILPRRSTEKRIRMLNKSISTLAREHQAIFADPGKVLLDRNGLTDEKLFVDGLHPNEEGYHKLMEEIKKIIK